MLDSAPEVLASGDDYAVIVDALRARRIALGLSCEELDDRAGFTTNYANKLENYDKHWGRGFGPLSLALWLQALGVKITLTADQPPTSKQAHHHYHREQLRVRCQLRRM